MVNMSHEDAPLVIGGPKHDRHPDYEILHYSTHNPAYLASCLIA